MKKHITGFALSLMTVVTVLSQSHPVPELGKPMPDFTLNKVTHYEKKAVSLEDFKGKWLFMDFWFTGCIACIKSFPKVSELQKTFKDEAVFLLVGLNDQKFNNGIENLYERLREKQGLVMPVAYDSILAERWNIQSMPYILVVDPQGVVRYITDGRNLTIEAVKRLTNGEEVSLFPHGQVRENLDFDALNAFGTREKLLFQSILTEWNGEKQYVPSSFSTPAKDMESYGEFKLVMVPLFWLYNYVYFRNVISPLWPSDSLYHVVYPYPALEIKDSSLFEYDYKIEVGKGTYNYNLVFPPSKKVTTKYILDKMQEDLKTTFGFEASVETREMPVWKLVTKDKNSPRRLKTKGGEPSFEAQGGSFGPGGFTMRNLTMDKFLEFATAYLRAGDKMPIPYFNETDITTKIDITMDCDMTNFEAVVKELQKNGLDLVKGTRKMKVVVIKDPAGK